MNIKNIALAALTGVMILSSTSCLKDDSEAQRAEEKKILKEYVTNNSISVAPFESGLYYIPTLIGTGDSIMVDDWMELKYTARLLSNSQVVMTSDLQIAKDNNIDAPGIFYGPTRLVLNSQLSPIGLREGIAKMKEGGKARLILPSDICYGGNSYGAIPAYSTLIFDVELYKVIPDIKAYEHSLLVSYLNDPLNEMSTDSTAAGIYFKETKLGTGDLPVEGKLVTVTYVGKFLNGTEFDRSGKSFNVTIGTSGVIPGFEEGVKLIRKGGSGRVVIPYNNAYGSTGRFDNYGRNVIPPYTSLVFDINVTNIAK